MRKELKIKPLSKKTLKDAFKEFILHCRVKNLADATLTFYEESYNRFTKFYDDDNLVKDITKQTVDYFILNLRNTELESSISFNTAINGVRVMLYYFMKMGYLEDFKIPSMKQEKKIKETYTEQEIKILLVKPDLNESEFVNFRDWTVINTLLATGMRVRTLINLKICDVDLKNQLLHYTTTKNRYHQIVPVSRTLVNVLKEYIDIRNADEEDWLFCSRYGDKLTNNAIQHSLIKYNNRRGVMRTGIHLWRHTFAKIWIINGKGDPFRLQQILGHADLSTVKEYMDLFLVDLQKDFDLINPLELMQPTTNKGKYVKIKK
ncbi:tyrosine-type recombinase/integrase [Clostridium sp. FP1]|uniref:tyrosine-type recombinase/integrase n=1 Tax=Clostridium sp. FP1 TaxID=2724076 RepID=UPI0013E94561|nr:tyrosine-type recombinase/integrase [Clostridium sp. FP1]MBZ9635537.1 tyrosine-type recombinase/integrase [Clostridium sp. FP1]